MDYLDQGMHKIPDEVYHADPCPEASLSRGTINNLLYETPADVFHNNPRLNPFFIKPEKDDKFNLGTTAHALLLEGENVVGLPSIDLGKWSEKGGKAEKERIKGEGKIPMLAHQFDAVCAMVDIARREIPLAPEIKKYKFKDFLTEGYSEQVFVWQENGVWYRIKIDWISPDFKLIIDYKTSVSANPSKFAKQVPDFGYDIQKVLYSRGVEVVTGVKPKFIFAVQEDKAPHLLSFHKMSGHSEEVGQQKIDYGTFLWKQCLSTGEWPGYPKETNKVEPTSWALTQWEEIAAEIGE